MLFRDIEGRQDLNRIGDETIDADAGVNQCHIPSDRLEV